MPADVTARSVEGIRCTYMVRAYREIRSILQDLTLNVPEAYKLFPWIVREYKRGHLSGYVAGLPYRNQEGQVVRPSFDTITNEKITEIRALFWRLWRHLEYVRTNPTMQSPNIMELSYDDADQWCNQREEAGTDVGDTYQWDARQPLLRFEDGYAWYRLESRNDLRQEGDVMGNCVGGYATRVETGATTVLSLRDNRGVPHTTLEIPGKPLDEVDGLVTIYQIQGTANTDPKEVYKEKTRQLIAWLRAQGYEVYATSRQGEDDNDYVNDADTLMEWWGNWDDEADEYTLGGRAEEYGLTHIEGEERPGCDFGGSLSDLAASCMENQISYGDHPGGDLARALADAAAVNGVTGELPNAYSAAEEVYEDRIREQLEEIKDNFERQFYDEFRDTWVEQRIEQLQIHWKEEYAQAEAAGEEALAEWEWEHPEPDAGDVDEDDFDTDFENAKEEAWDDRMEDAREEAEDEISHEARNFLNELHGFAMRQRRSHWFILAGFQRYSADIHALAAEKRAELINREDVKDWCSNQALYIETTTGRPFTMELLRFIFVNILQNIEDVNYKMMEWAWREFKRGTISYEGNQGVNSWQFFEDVNRFGNWLRWCEEYHRPAPDWKARAFGYQAMLDWMAQMGEKTPDFDPNAPQWENRETIYEFPDGWTIDLVTTPADLSLEGREMGHCVGSYGSSVEGGNAIVYSLRDPRGYPHATFEFEGWGQSGVAPHNTNEANWHIIQIQGKEDTEPIREYKQRIGEFFRHLRDTQRNGITLGMGDFEEADWEEGRHFEVNTLQDLVDLGQEIENDPEAFTEPGEREENSYDDDYGLDRRRYISIEPHSHDLQRDEGRLVTILEGLLRQILEDPQSVSLDKEDQGEAMSLAWLGEVALGAYGVCAMNFETYKTNYGRNYLTPFNQAMYDAVLEPLYEFVDEAEQSAEEPQESRLISEEEYADYKEYPANRVVRWFLAYLDRLFQRSQELRPAPRNPLDMRQMRQEVNPFHSGFPGAFSHRKARLINGVLVPEWDRHLVGV